MVWEFSRKFELNLITANYKKLILNYHKISLPVVFFLKSQDKASQNVLINSDFLPKTVN